jgi:anti-sigma regulatory factor (Ser/Thr protein kinase)
MISGRPPPFRYRLSASRERALALRRELRDWLHAAGLGERAAFEVGLACWEAVTNAIEHPLTPTSPVIDITAAIENKDVTVTIRDYGAWRARPRRKDGGLGFPLMRSMMNLVKVDHRPEGTRITLSRRLAQNGVRGS